jgi:hypothetical protein
MAGLDVAAICSTCAVAAALLVHVMRYAYGQGRTDERLKALERGHEDLGEARQLMAALTATVTALKESVDGLQAAVGEIRRHLFQTQGAP